MKPENLLAIAGAAFGIAVLAFTTKSSATPSTKRDILEQTLLRAGWSNKNITEALHQARIMVEYAADIAGWTAAYDVDSVTHIVVEAHVPKSKYAVFCTISHLDTELRYILGIYEGAPANAGAHEIGYTPVHLDVCGKCDDIITEFAALCDSAHDKISEYEEDV